MTVIERKAELFDILVEQENLHARLRQLEELKQCKLQELVMVSVDKTETRLD